ncbi:SHOCT domain-containing protein [Demequina sp. NBRC 110055]|uniref:SHOCT domain-containing protein n=1 Tax=Demequina sp. NBRC 110055 TaxID=1570344 RepID=UPI00190EEBD7|nr:SHOCT domain-containing protein [Demequina sp. NBRC 110055]
MRGIEVTSSLAPTIWAGVFWLLGAAVIGAFIYLSVRLLADNRPSQAVQPVPTADAVAGQAPAAPEASLENATPKQILDERLARGDIDLEEYQARLAAMGHA